MLDDVVGDVVELIRCRHDQEALVGFQPLQENFGSFDILGGEKLVPVRAVFEVNDHGQPVAELKDRLNQERGAANIVLVNGRLAKCPGLGGRLLPG